MSARAKYSHTAESANQPNYQKNPTPDGYLDGSGGGGHDDGMNQRLDKLETFAEETRDRLARIETRMDTFATKEDLSKLDASLQKDMNAQTWKIIAACGLLVAACFFIARYVAPAPDSLTPPPRPITSQPQKP